MCVCVCVCWGGGLNPEALSANTETFSSAWKRWEDKNDLGVNVLI